MGVWKREWKNFLAIVAVFLVCYYLPVGTKRFDNAVLEAFHLVKWYAQEHVLLCLVPAFFIAGAVGVFVSQASVMKYLGAKANKVLAYGVAAVSGTILAVCSCTILPLFSGIYRMGAGLGPACAFLYSGPAINVLAIVLTARVLGLELGIARAVGAVIFSIVIGLLMHFIFRREEEAKAAAQMAMPEPEIKRNLLQNGLYFASMVGILVFANWGKPQEAEGLWVTIYNLKWVFTGVFYLIFSVILSLWFGLKPYKAVASVAAVSVAGLIYPDYPLVPFTVGSMALVLFTSTQKGELSDWFDTSWDFAKKILPLLLFGVVIAGALLGRVGNEGLIPSEWIAKAVGGNSLWANFFASFAGAFMYFATLTEVPILQGLIGSGMGKGPALALLLAGPALSLPNMLVIRSVLGTKKTVVFVSLVIFMATLSGMIFGSIFS
ncbi:MAG: permease [Candidatus Ozemobacteraceae bacterium]|nr:permease [Candidatus Riflebacteria bacterium]